MNRMHIVQIASVLAAAIFVSGPAYAEDWTTLLDLRGQWKFELGDSARWSDPKYNDNKWDDISVPSPWEEEGYPGYDGYAWYRKHFTASQKMSDDAVYLHLGYVDDVCEVYLNGRLIGSSGSFPPAYQTAYDVYQQYAIPPELLNFSGDNIIAVRVYDDQLSGGIIRGKVGFYQLKDHIALDIRLAGMWKFKVGDEMAWKEISVDDRGWKDALVPSYWDYMGLRDYDGYGWYRKKFRLPADYRNKQLVLLLGKVDDFDETYLNGQRIGRTGIMRPDIRVQELGGAYAEQRAYTIPASALRDGENVLAVRVYDGYLQGGIYEGPIGIVTREHYMQWRESRKGLWRIFDFFK